MPAHAKHSDSACPSHYETRPSPPCSATTLRQSAVLLSYSSISPTTWLTKSIPKVSCIKCLNAFFSTIYEHISPRAAPLLFPWSSYHLPFGICIGLPDVEPHKKRVASFSGVRERAQHGIARAGFHDLAGAYCVLQTARHWRYDACFWFLLPFHHSFLLQYPVPLTTDQSTLAGDSIFM